MTIAQIVYDNEKSFGYTDDEIHEKVGSFVTSRYLLDTEFGSSSPPDPQHLERHG